MTTYQEALEAIRQQANLVDIVTERIKIKRRGKNITALCPFHDDQNPSLSISESKQIFKCFSCGMGGDLFKFVMEFDQVDFKEAVKYLAKKYRISLPKFATTEKTYVDPHLGFKSINDWGCRIYHQYLFKAQNAELARNYIRKRQISLKMLKAFRIGYAPNKRNFLIELYQDQKKINSANLEQIGLFTKNKYNQVVDFFFNRIIFPIINEKNEVLGFGARVITKTGIPKYLNSKESPWFKKGEILYGFRESYPYLIKKKEVFLVEGYLDVIACHDLEIPAVAPLGTSLTSKQITKLKRYTEKVNLFFDGDQAGKKAALKAATELISHEIDGQVYLLEEGDPFDFIQKSSTEKINHFFKHQGINLYDFLITAHLEESRSPVDKKNQLEELSLTVRRLKNKILKEDLIKKIEKAFHISWENVIQSQKKTFYPLRKRLTKKPSISSEDKNLIGKERSFILFLCNHPEWIKQSLKIINLKELSDPWSIYVYKKLIQIKDRTDLSFHQILELFSDEKDSKVVDFINQQSLKYELLKNETFSSHHSQKNKNDLLTSKTDSQELISQDFNLRVIRLKIKYIQKKRKILRQKIKQCELQEEQEKLEKLQEERIGLDLEEESLKDYFDQI